MSGRPRLKGAQAALEYFGMPDRPVEATALGNILVQAVVGRLGCGLRGL